MGDGRFLAVVLLFVTATSVSTTAASAASTLVTTSMTVSLSSLPRTLLDLARKALGSHILPRCLDSSHLLQTTFRTIAQQYLPSSHKLLFAQSDDGMAFAISPLVKLSGVDFSIIVGITVVGGGYVG